MERNKLSCIPKTTTNNYDLSKVVEGGTQAIKATLDIPGHWHFQNNCLF